VELLKKLVDNSTSQKLLVKKIIDICLKYNKLVEFVKFFYFLVYRLLFGSALEIAVEKYLVC